SFAAAIRIIPAARREEVWSRSMRTQESRFGKLGSFPTNRSLTRKCPTVSRCIGLQEARFGIRRRWIPCDRPSTSEQVTLEQRHHRRPPTALWPSTSTRVSFSGHIKQPRTTYSWVDATDR